MQADPRQRKLVTVLLRLELAGEANSDSIFQKEFQAVLIRVFDVADRNGSLTPASAALAFNATPEGLVTQ